MTSFTGSILIRRTSEEVFDFVADERDEPTYNPEIPDREDHARADRRGRPVAGRHDVGQAESAVRP
ncbi:hypothetical protein [Arthrobacter sp. B3I4]|uniref:hypothetical protein n=1 Tax=Arthrobacter sp. B3I4 TaxID=3042267 RepID=UPI0027861DC8|nr:hypothetical protein [Arthrobacter sp. B3I4]MDQ0757287.1 hypothetical protein [Arthrobacter sp. B3I4]